MDPMAENIIEFIQSQQQLIKNLKEENKDLQLLVDKNTNIVEYQNKQLEKYKSLILKLKMECDKVKE